MYTMRGEVSDHFLTAPLNGHVATKTTKNAYIYESIKRRSISIYKTKYNYGIYSTSERSTMTHQIGRQNQKAE